MKPNRWEVRELEIIMKALVILIFILCSGYVMTFSKPKTGIKLDYVFVVIFILIILVRM